MGSDSPIKLGSGGGLWVSGAEGGAVPSETTRGRQAVRPTSSAIVDIWWVGSGPSVPFTSASPELRSRSSS